MWALRDLLKWVFYEGDFAFGYCHLISSLHSETVNLSSLFFFFFEVCF